MIAGPLVFVDVDTQRDFLDPSGALFVPGSEGILGNLKRLTDFARREGIPVLATACSHASGDPELARFGPHCLAGSYGQGRVAATSWGGGEVVGPGGGPAPPPPPRPRVGNGARAPDASEEGVRRLPPP